MPVCSMVEQKADRLLDGAILRGRNGFCIFEKAEQSGALTLVEAAEQRQVIAAGQGGMRLTPLDDSVGIGPEQRIDRAKPYRRIA